jgi:hypothetical protein
MKRRGQGSSLGLGILESITSRVALSDLRMLEVDVGELDLSLTSFLQGPSEVLS